MAIKNRRKRRQLRFDALEPRRMLCAHIPVVSNPSTVGGPEIWALRNVEYSDRYLSAADDGNAVLSLSDDSRERWIVRAGRGVNTFQNESTGLYLASNDYNIETVSTVSDAARWITYSFNGSLSFRNVATGRYIDGDGSGDDWDVDESESILDDDRWFVTRCDSDPVSDSSNGQSEIWTLRNREFDSFLYETFDSDVLTRGIDAPRAQWKVTTIGLNEIALQNVFYGDYLAASDFEAYVSETQGPDTVWRVVDNIDRSISLQNVQSGRFLDADAGSQVDESEEILLDDGWFRTIYNGYDSLPIGDGWSRSDIIASANDDSGGSTGGSGGFTSGDFSFSGRGSSTGSTVVFRDSSLAGSVQSTDLGMLLESFANQEVPSGYAGGFDGSDGLVDSSDLGSLLESFGEPVDSPDPGDPVLTPLHALQVINELDDRQYSDSTTGTLTSNETDALQLDHDNDGRVTPFDALLVINALDEQSSAEAALSSDVFASNAGDEEEANASLEERSRIADAIWAV